MVEESRVQFLNRKSPLKGEYVLYWMQASQRVEHNHALEFAVGQANENKLPLIVYFGVTENFPEANERHYHFMLEGLREVRKKLHDKGIGMVIEHSSPEIGVVNLAHNASLIVCDRGYLHIQKDWRRYVAERIGCPLIQVESEVIVPVETASPKEEYSAATLRRKLFKNLVNYLVPLPEETPFIDSTRLAFESFNIENIDMALSGLNIDRSVKPVSNFTGGTSHAKKRLEMFLDVTIPRYHELRNDPNENAVSNLSPYLHFGQISAAYVALQVTRQNSPGNQAFLDELIVRRELSMNYVHYNKCYDSYEGLPDWAIRTLRDHEFDKRPYLYSAQELEKARTHDEYWNAAQKEMMETGKMHGYMRMYWGKKILEWTADPAEAFSTALYLNNKYELDGRDPNSFAGVAWCFGKHDRPWGRRPVFGNVRYMSADGLKRKFDIDKYTGRFNR